MTPKAYVVLAVCLTLALEGWRRRRPKHLPPGPPPGLLGDNTHQVPVSHTWKTFYEWHQQYGHVISFYLGRTPVIVLGSAKAAWDLLDKRGEIYSSRPRSIMGSEILSGGMRGIGMPYGQRWRNWKSLQQAGMNTNAAKSYHNHQSLESFLLLRDVHADPTTFRESVTRYTMSVVVRVAYGRRVKTLHDDIVTRNRNADAYFAKIHVVGKFLVESWPILLWIPRSLQWFRWEPEAQQKKDEKHFVSLLNTVRQQIEDGTVRECMAAIGLQKQAQFGMSDPELAYALSAPWQAGLGTTTITVEVFLLAMLFYPNVMKKAQQEIDAVVGRGRFPDFSDEASLPYIKALIKEVTRWRPIAPTGFAHAVTEDDWYEGMFIPKGSTVYANIYAICRDPSMFPDPLVFLPERFLGEHAHDPKFANFTIPFGFGRRMCPGMHVAMQSVYIIVSRILWAFDVVPQRDMHGEPILPLDPALDDGTSGLITRPSFFQCDFVPRNSDVVDMITREAQSAEYQLSEWL